MLTSIQLEGYKQGLESHGLDIKHKAILHLKKNGDYTFDSDYSQNDKTAIDVLNALLTIHRYKKLYGKN
jgi:DNA-binding LacI/PurR family transcriptional regulator